MRIRKSVQMLTPYVPGEQPKAARVVKLNTNENPYPPSPEVKKLLESLPLENLRKYPDPVFAALRERIAAVYGTSLERVFVGNGSDEVLSLACHAFVEDDEAIAAFNPSYSLYHTLAEIRSRRFVSVELDEGFDWVDPLPAAKEGNVALFMLTNPNAPTSVRYDDAKVEAFASAFPGVVLIDEAYADFSGKTCMKLAACEDNRNVIVLRTLSKSFSLAGLRLGFCVGPEDLIEALYKIKDSYNVDALAQSVALAALNDLEWMLGNTAKIVKTRTAFVDALRLRGWDVPESATNFVFARPPHRSADEIFRRLKERNIFVRYFPGPRTGDRLRITIGTDEEMAVLLAELDSIEKGS